MSNTPLTVEQLKNRMLQKSYFIMFRTMKDPSLIEGSMYEHYQWMISMEKRDLVFASGPLFRKDGERGVGMTIFKVDNFMEAEKIAANDPFVRSGAVCFEIQRWQINEGRINISVDFSDQTYNFN
jgi:uncharacterized protein YciI